MDETADPSIKFCQVCKENVHLCEDDISLIEALKNNWCVAMYDKYDSGIPTLIGDVSSDYFPADNN